MTKARLSFSSVSRTASLLLQILVVLHIQALMAISNDVQPYLYSISNEEMQSLYDLYLINNGSTWDWKNNTALYGVAWNFTMYESTGTIPHVCQDELDPTQHWQGVECSSNCTYSPCHVTSLQLIDYGLHGSVPPSLVNLTSLTSLDLSYNFMVGSIPSNFGELSSLSTLILSYNHFTSSLPTSMLNLASLRHLQLDNNRFKGRLPDSLGHAWSQLEYFNININQFSGSLPSTLLELYALESFQVSNNLFLTALPAFSNLTTPHLSVLQMEAITYTTLSTIPQSYYTLTSLQDLRLGSYNLQGSISEAIQNWQAMRILSFSSTSLTGSLPEGVGTLKQLSALNINICPLTGTLPKSLVQLTALTQLYIFDTFLSGPFPALDTFPELLRLSIGMNKFNGSIPGFVDTPTSPSKLLTYSVSYNRFSGMIPISLSHLTAVEYVDFTSNQLTSSLPAEVISNWTDVVNLFVSFNDFTGTLPSQIFDNTLPKLVYFATTNSHFSGNLSHIHFGNLSAMVTLQLNNNLLSGSLPESFCALPELATLYLETNFFSDHLPNCFYNMSSLAIVAIDDNLFSGPFLSVAWPELKQLALQYNRFTGWLPQEGWDISPDFLTASMNFNFFSGPLPTMLLTLSQGTSEIDVSNNLLSGNIDFTLTKNGSSVRSWYFGCNEFDGDLTPLFSNLSTTITALQLINNQFTGSLLVPPDVAQQLTLSALDMSANFLTGTIPESVNALSHLGTFSVSENLLTGSIPASTGSMLGLQLMNVSFNAMTGTVPTTWQQWQLINYVDISNNAFTGSLIDRFNYATKLASLLVQNNHLTGRIDSLVSPNAVLLEVLDFSDNQFTGPLPTDVFTASTQNLISFAAVKNCLTGTIPDLICKAGLLQSLALDGLHSSDSCNSNIYESLSGSLFAQWISQSSYMLKSPISGTIPSCLFHMPMLQLLHLSGNGIDDKLTDLEASDGSCTISRYLTDLSLSNNVLRGSIPACVQQHAWVNLDLSFNFFNGELSPILNVSNAATSSLSLYVNRLSGGIPASVMDLSSINILKGNLFNCKYNEYAVNQGVPSEDESSQSYSCGSNAVNASLYVFMAAFAGIVLLVSIVVYCYVHRTPETAVPSKSSASWLDAAVLRIMSILLSCKRVYNHWTGADALAASQKSTDREAQLFLHLNQSLRQMAVLVTIFIVVVLMSTYTVLSHDFSTYNHKYSYRLGFMFLSGASPAIVMLMLLAAFYAFVKVLVRQINKDDAIQEEATPVVSARSTSSWRTDIVQLLSIVPSSTVLQSWATWWVYWVLPIFALFLVNVVVTLVVNMSYVYAESLNQLPDSTLLVIALSVSLFKVVWNNELILVAMPSFLHFCKNTTLQKLRAFAMSPSKSSLPAASNDNPLHSALLSQQTILTPVVPAPPVAQSTDQWTELNRRLDRQILVAMLLISIFTNVLAPYISSFLFNPNCFYYTVSTMKPVVSTYAFPQCYKYDVNSGWVSCVGYISLHRAMSFIPPFIYNYQCSSSLIQSFTAVYIYRYVISGILLPIVLLVGCQCHRWLKSMIRVDRAAKAGNMGDRLWASVYFLLDAVLPLGWKLYAQMDTDVDAAPSNNSGINSEEDVRGSISLKLTFDGRQSSMAEDLLAVTTTTTTSIADKEEQGQKEEYSVRASSTHYSNRSLYQLEFPSMQADLVKLFSREKYVLRLAGEFSVLLTFGVVFPPLAIVICVAILTQTWMTQRLTSILLSVSKKKERSWEEASRVSSNATKMPSKYEMLLIAFPQHFQQQCHEITSYITLVIPYVSVFMMLFLSFSLFDTMGDANGDAAGFGMLAALAAIPILEYAVYDSIQLYYAKTR